MATQSFSLDGYIDWIDGSIVDFSSDALSEDGATDFVLGVRSLGQLIVILTLLLIFSSSAVYLEVAVGGDGIPEGIGSSIDSSFGDVAGSEVGF